MRLIPSFSRRAEQGARLAKGGSPHFERISSSTVLVSGLVWEVPLHGEGSTIGSLRQLARRSRSSLYLVQTASRQHNASYFAFLPGKRPRGATRVVSLAAWFAAVSKEDAAVYVRPAIGDLVSVALATNGEPDPEVDRVMTPDEALRLFETQRRLALKTRVVFDAAFGESLPTWAEPIKDFARIANPFAGEPPPQAILKPLPQAKRSPMRTGLVLVAGLGLATYLLYTEYYEPWAQAQKPKGPPPVPPEKAYLNSRDAALKQAEPHVPAAPAIKRVAAELGEVPLARGGYLLSAAKCEMAKGDCALSWRAQAGNYLRYVEADPSRLIGARYSADLQLRGAVPLSMASQSITAERLLKEQDFLRDVGSRWQDINRVLSGKATFGPAALVGRYTGSMGEQLPGRVLSGSWQLDLPLGVLYLLEDLPSSMTLNTIEIRVGQPGESRFIANGTYYVR